MNDRIKELADEAKQFCFEQSQKRLSPEDYMPYSDMYDKKFAELIIKETLQVARAGIEYGNGMEDAVYRYFEIGMTTEDKKTLIKELLGVKNETN